MELFGLFKNDKTTKTDAEIEALIIKLDVLGYFKYTDEEFLQEVKQEVGTSLIYEHWLTSPHFDDDPLCSKDHRHYFFDGEDLFEQSGFTDMFSNMKVLFEKLDFKITITNHIEDWDEENKWLNHSLTINEKDYIIFRNFCGYGWGEAAQRFTEIINDQLQLQNIEERLYLCDAGNGGLAVFLTPALYSYIFPELADPIGSFMPVEQWCKIMQVDSLKYLGD